MNNVNDQMAANRGFTRANSGLYKTRYVELSRYYGAHNETWMVTFNGKVKSFNNFEEALDVASAIVALGA